MTRNKQWIIITIFGLAAVAMSLLHPILPLYLTALEIAPEIIGLMFSLSMIAMAIGEGYWGWAADRVGAWIPLAVGTFLCGFTVLFFTLVEELFYIFIIFFFWGLFRSAIFGPSRGFIAAGAPVGKKTTHLAIVTAIIAVSSSLGALPSGYIAEVWGFRTVFYLSSAISLLGGLLVLWGYKNTIPVKYKLQGKFKLKLNYQTKALTLQCLVTAFQFFGLGIIVAFLPLLVTGRTGVSMTEVGILISVRGLVAMLFSLPMGMLADRIGNRVMMIFGLFTTAFSMLAFSLASGFAAFIAIVVLYNIGYTAFSPAALSLFSSSSPPERQGTAMGFYGAICENTGIVAGSALGGFIWSAWGGQAAFMAGAASSLTGALIFIIYTRLNIKNV